jgi:hypothetical protein
MTLAGILLLGCAALSVMFKPVERVRSPKLTHLILLFQGVCAALIFLWAGFYLITSYGFYGQLLIQHLGLALFLVLLCSYLVLLGLGFLMCMIVGLKLFGKYHAHEDRLAQLAGILPPLALICACIGLWDILYVTFWGSLLIS